MPYDHQSIEQKWQKFWDENQTFAVTEDTSKPKKYLLDMFPYPSGAGLHVGHPKGFTATDILARYYHATGHNVLHPMGFDAFGLPAENYAIKTGTHPAVTTAENVETFISQLKSLGFNYDWNRMVDTTDPEYYKWTQWIFLELFKRGLAYEQDLPINYCPSCKTGLANEEVLSDNTCDRCGTKVERRPIRQWVLRITEYADRLLSDIEGLDWPEGIKEMQRNWIGKSEGCEFRLLKDEGFRYSRATLEDFNQILGIRQETGAHAVDFAQEQFFVAKKDGKIAGFIRTQEYGDFTELGALYVGENFRGDKLGYKLISYAIEHTNTSEFYMDCKKELQGYYEKFGFTILDTPKPFQLEKLRKVWDFYGRSYTEQEILDNTIFMTIKGESTFPRLPSIAVYTTRVDTVYGMTYAVLAPDHPHVEDFITDEQRVVCEAYITDAKSKSDQDRTADNKEKTGVFTGSYVINPYNGESVPLWIADYVLGHYGTGAVMAVPAHDERDGEFARKYGLPIKQSIAKVAIHTGNSAMREGVETLNRQVIDVILENQKGEFLLIEENNPQDFHFIGGGIEDGDDELTTVKKEILEESGYSDIEIMGEIVGSYIYSEGFRHTKQKNQKTGGKFYHVKLASENRVHSEIETGHHKMIWLSKNEIANTITWEAHLHAWNLFLGKIQPTTEDGKLVDSNEFSGLLSAEARKILTQKAETEGFGSKKVNYKLRDWLFSRQRYWGEPIPLIHLSMDDVKNLPHISDISEAVDMNQAYILKREPNYGEDTTGTLCHGKVRELIIGGQVFSKIYDGINGKIIIDSRLPITLPNVERYEPAGDGQSPLATVPDWVNVKLAENLNGKRETNTMPQWGGSCWYYLRYMDNKNSDALAGEAALEYWNNVDEYVGGAEHAVLHLLYARFWHKVLYDIGVVPTIEPFQKLVNQGMILAYAYERQDGGLVAVDLVEERDGKYIERETGKEVRQVVAKMSKSLKNVVNPNDIVRDYGADTLRLYEMNMGAFTDTAPWNPDAIVGVRRFLDKAYAAFMAEVKCEVGSVKSTETETGDKDMKRMKLLHKTIKKVGEDIVGYKFNTAISALMILVNEGIPADAEFATEWKEKFAILLHPFAPHMAEELYQLTESRKQKADVENNSTLPTANCQLPTEQSVYFANWPEYDEFMLVDDEVTIAVQVNGKLRGTLTCFNGVAQEEVSLLARENPDIAKWLEGKTLVKEIFIPNRMLSIVVKDI